MTGTGNRAESKTKESNMAQTFKLDRAAASICPADGEDLGAALAHAAEAKETAHRDNPEARVMFWGGTVAQMYYLAAEAFEHGASASIGHNRTGRYLERANAYRQRALAIEVEAVKDREAAEAKSMKAAFIAGYESETGDATRYAFESREAFLVGRHFIRSHMPIPESVRVIRGERGAHWIEAGDCLYSVEYPGGKINDAIVTRKDD